MTNEKLNLQPLQEFLNREVDLNELIQHLDNIYYHFSQYSMKVSFWDDVPVEEKDIVCQYWIERLKLLFEEIKN